MAEPIKPVCDVCGKPATHGCRDTYRIEPWDSPYVKFRPIPDSEKYGCNDHAPEPKEVTVSTSPPIRSYP